MMPWYFVLPALALSGAVGWLIGWIRTEMRWERHVDAQYLRERQRGYTSGHAHGWWAASVRAGKVLEATYPTSRGGKAIVKALNAGPDPEPRIDTAHVSTTDSRAISNYPGMHTARINLPVMDAGSVDGPETP